MRNKTILLNAVVIALFAVVSISGCTKPDDTPSHCTNGVKDGDETGVDCGGSCSACTSFSLQVKTIDYNGTIDSLIYDTQNRQLSSLSVGAIQITYSYGSGVVTSNFSLGPNNHKVIYALNSQGYASSAIDSSSDGTTLHTQYTYDTEGHLTSAIITNPAYPPAYDSTIYTWLDGNLVNRYNHDYNYSTGTNTVWTYLANSTNTIANNNMGLYFWGKDSKNLQSELTSGAYTETYTYQYDSHNRVSKQITNGSGGDTYTYY